MPVVQDELWKRPGNPGMIVITSHASVGEDGRLFLGYHAGREALRRIPDIERQCGQAVLAGAVDGIYGFLPVRPPRPDQRIVGFGLFQTHLNWNQSADLELIRYSMECLRRYARENAEMKIRMNFPGLGEGGLEADDVAPLLLPLPESVTICHQGELPRSIPGSFPGFKSLYQQVVNLLQEGRSQQAVRFLMNHGFDIQSAMDQVNAVERCLKDKNAREAEGASAWRKTRS